MPQTMSDMPITKWPSRTIPCLDVLQHQCTVPAVFIHQSGSVLSVKYDMQTPLLWFILRVIVRSEGRDKEDMVETV